MAGWCGEHGVPARREGPSAETLGVPQPTRQRRRRNPVQQQRQYVGIDLHRRRSVIVRMTPEGERVGGPVRIDNDPFELAAQVASWGESPEVVLEATYGWYWAADALAAAGAEVHLAHPLGVKAFSYRRVKNDERDAADLADLLADGGNCSIHANVQAGWPLQPAHDTGRGHEVTRRVFGVDTGLERVTGRRTKDEGRIDPLSVLRPFGRLRAGASFFVPLDAQRTP